MVFFEFLQVIVGNRESLSVGMSNADWQRLFDFCKKQALLGVGFSAVEKLHAIGVVCPSNIRMQWYSYAVQIERMNDKLNKQSRELVERMEHDGLQCCVLKGQSNLENYPEGLRMRRQSGDIDVWCVAPAAGLSLPNASLRDYAQYHDIDAVIEYVRMQYRLQDIDIKPKACYHHIEAHDIESTEVEVHYRPAFLRSPIRNWRMQRWFKVHSDVCMKNRTHLCFSMMTASVNVVYQMCHLYTHVFEGGIGLRQLMDYYFALRVWHNDVMECKDLQSQGMWSEGIGTPVMSATEIMAVLRTFGMGKFAGAVMWVLKEVFVGGHDNENENSGRQQEQHKTTLGPQADGSWSEMLRNGQELKENNNALWLLCEPNEVEGKRLLAEIMQGGNFGQYDTRDVELKKGGMMKHGLWKLKRVMRLVSSYPEEALWEPVFRLYHLGWRLIH